MPFENYTICKIEIISQYESISHVSYGSVQTLRKRFVSAVPYYDAMVNCSDIIITINNTIDKPQHTSHIQGRKCGGVWRGTPPDICFSRSTNECSRSQNITLFK